MYFLAKECVCLITRVLFIVFNCSGFWSLAFSFSPCDRTGTCGDMVRMGRAGRDCNATAACHVALDKGCYHTDPDSSRAGLFAWFTLFTTSISASSAALEDSVDPSGRFR